jgi:hypothetical protein
MAAAVAQAYQPGMEVEVKQRPSAMISGSGAASTGGARPQSAAPAVSPRRHLALPCDFWVCFDRLWRDYRTESWVTLCSVSILASWRF